MRVFEPLEFGPVRISSRIVRSATNEYAGDVVGLPDPALADLYAALAIGDCPLIVTGYAYVQTRGRSSPVQSAVTTDEHIRRWAYVAEKTHAANKDVRIAMQIVHGGRQSEANLVGEPIAPSAVPVGDVTPREMTAAEIEDTINAFAQAARRAADAGIDAVQLHLAHGYLLSEFLSPHTNRRTDDFGGSPRKRRRVPLAVVARVREAIGAEVPILVKMNCADFVPGGLEPDEAAEHAAALEEAGVDGIEISGWMMEGDPEASPSRPGDPTGKSEAFFLEQARVMRKAVKRVPLGLCGGIRSAQRIEDLLAGEGFDFVAMSRPFIAEPDLVANLKAGAQRVKCTSCNRCTEDHSTVIYCPVAKEGKL